MNKEIYYKTTLSITMLLIYLPLSTAMPIPNPQPDDLIYQGKLINSFCIEDAMNQQTPIPLRQCGKNTPGLQRQLNKANATLLKQGYVGSDYQWSTKLNQGPSVKGSCYYRVVGEHNHQSIIMTLRGTGGSGEFSGLYAVNRSNDTIQLNPIALGDRCNGGVTKAIIDHGTLDYNLNLTPYDLLSLSKANDAKTIKAYEDLAACAVCCQGQATYEIQAGDSTDNKKLIQVDLGTTPIRPEQNTQGKYQACFNQILADYQKTKGQYIKADKINGLMSQFIKTCTH